MVNGEYKPYPGGYLWKNPIDMAKKAYIQKVGDEEFNKAPLA